SSPSWGASAANAVLQEIAIAVRNGISPRSCGKELRMVNPSTVSDAGQVTGVSGWNRPEANSRYAAISLKVEPGGTAAVSARLTGCGSGPSVLATASTAPSLTRIATNAAGRGSVA